MSKAKMTGEVSKTYEQIAADKKEKKSMELVPVSAGDLIKVQSVEEMLDKASDLVPAINKQLMATEEALPEAFKEKWLSTVEEANHSLEIMPQRRTLSEKKTSVLQANRHPTASSKFHQATLEQGVYAGQLLDATFELKKSKIKLEKEMYKHKKKLEEIDLMQAEGKDTFLLEKEIEENQIDLARQVMSLKNLQMRLQNLREEIVEWSDIKEELYKEANEKGEIWSPDAVDGDAQFQEIPLVLRHLQNYIILKTQPGDASADISSVLNIEGLALTAVQSGLKENKLGLFFKDIHDEHIKLIWLHMYGRKVEIQRHEGYMVTVFDDGKTLIHPTTLKTYNEFLEQTKVK